MLSIGDGDTIRVRQAGNELVADRPTSLSADKLACIDAPESAQSPYGQQARKSLQQRLPRGRQVSIQSHATDHYGRRVAEVISDINITW